MEFSTQRLHLAMQAREKARKLRIEPEGLERKKDPRGAFAILEGAQDDREIAVQSSEPDLRPQMDRDGLVQANVACSLREDRETGREKQRLRVRVRLLGGGQLESALTQTGEEKSEPWRHFLQARLPRDESVEVDKYLGDRK